MLISKVAYGGRIRMPPEAMLEEIRRQAAQGMARLLHLGSLGGGAHRQAAGVSDGDGGLEAEAGVERAAAAVQKHEEVAAKKMPRKKS